MSDSFPTHLLAAHTLVAQDNTWSPPLKSKTWQCYLHGIPGKMVRRQTHGTQDKRRREGSLCWRSHACHKVTSAIGKLKWHRVILEQFHPHLFSSIIFEDLTKATTLFFFFSPAEFCCFGKCLRNLNLHARIDIRTSKRNRGVRAQDERSHSLLWFWVWKKSNPTKMGTKRCEQELAALGVRFHQTSCLPPFTVGFSVLSFFLPLLILVGQSTITFSNTNSLWPALLVFFQLETADAPQVLGGLVAGWGI